MLPVVDEPLGAISEYGEDRAFVAVLYARWRGANAALSRTARTGAAVRCMRLTTSEPRRSAREFFRWEFATAVAGAALGVNPFDEPNVREAKIRTAGAARRASHDRAASGSTRRSTPGGLSAPRSIGRRQPLDRETTPPASRRAPYLALLDYLPSDPRRAGARRAAPLARCARTDHTVSTYGVGPRYLHSTGQYHKGGPNTGRFVLLPPPTRARRRCPAPTTRSARSSRRRRSGDFDALVAAGRDVVHYHIEDPSADFSETLENLLRHL